ncbi:FkbM family methyltransferase [Christiangramia portivictoriae]|uniref:FkbM family methyltransferase n=1 Tax=Christiangramia portivictoriae TaxID=326069 RepID=UPI00047D3CD1|nr:FkbM family methyltransferase [Christiangramia portivictoriae]
MQHFILTRFNLKKEDWREDKNAQEVLNETWEKDRVKLFKKFCLPSVLGQTNKNFRWMIFFQNNPSQTIKELLGELAVYSFIETVMLNSFEEFQQKLPNIVAKKISYNKGNLLTTRLDNDDGINKRFVEKLQDAASGLNQDTLIYFPFGLFLDYGKNCRLGMYKYPYNQFLSLFERVRENENINTVLSKAHDAWGDHPVRELNDKDAWLQVVHHQNMLNSFLGVPVYSYRLKKFNIKRIKFPIWYDLKLLVKGLRRRKERILGNLTAGNIPTPEESFDLPGTWIGKLLNKQEVMVVQIGSNDGKSGDPLFNLIAKWKSWKALFVEPVPYLFDQLKQNYGEVERFTFENRAVNDGSEQIFYSVPENIHDKIPDLPVWVEQLGSFKKNSITGHLQGKLEPYIEEIIVQGITLSELLKKNKVERIDLLHIDAEGYDWIILSQLDLSTFRPEIILYEHKHLPIDEKQASLFFLKSYNYLIYHLGSDYLCIQKSKKNQKLTKGLKGRKIA